MEKRCKTCGTPLDEVPFGHCAEHSAYEASQPSVSLSEDEAADIAYYEVMEGAYRYGHD